MKMTPNELDMKRQRIIQQVTVVGAITNIFLGVIKILVGIVGHSTALVADGIHSLADLLCDALAWVATYFSHQHADDNHPYGHRRFETAATFVLSFVLIVVGIGIALDAIRHVMDHTHQRPDTYTVWVALLSVLLNEGLFRYQFMHAKRLFSDLLRANAWHSRGDALSSLVVLVGLLGAISGWYFLDAIAAMIVGLFIVKIGLEWGWRALNELSDEAVDEQMRETLQKIIAETPGVEHLHQLRTRRMADQILLDVHVETLPYISVSEGHYIAELVRHRLKQEQPRVQDAIVHIDVDDDQHLDETTFKVPPDRAHVLSVLLPKWQQVLLPGELDRVILHYLDPGLEAHAIVKLTTLERLGCTAAELAGELQALTPKHLAKVELLLSL